MGTNFSGNSLPKKITPCPIMEAIVEFRFDSPFPHDSIFGIIYNAFREDYADVQELPILQLPEIVRKKDPLLLFKPYYKLASKDNFLLQVGARVISLISCNPYCGWSVFSERLNNLIQKVAELSIISSYTRVGIRYINGFDCNILEHINLTLNMRDKQISDRVTFIQMDCPSNSFISTLRITNNAKIKKESSNTNGSIIDIDTYIENPGSDLAKVINEGHLEEKKLFFDLVKHEFVKKNLNPEY